MVKNKKLLTYSGEGFSRDILCRLDVSMIGSSGMPASFLYHHIFDQSCSSNLGRYQLGTADFRNVKLLQANR